MISQSFLLFLGIVSVATIIFSMFHAPRIRGLRNIGFLAIYAGTIASLFLVGWKPVLAGWAMFGVGSGILYFLYELFATARSEEEEKEWPNPKTILNGLLMWPVMLPEAIEYFLADVGVLKAPKLPATTEGPSQEEEDV